MIKSLTVTNYLGEELYLELANPEQSGFAIEGISGLGPGKSTINITEIATNDGSLYNSAHIGSRNIVISLIFISDDIESARQKTYKYFAIKKPLHLVFETDNRICEIRGYVESNEPIIFSSRENTQISIICPSPYFYSSGKDSTSFILFSGVEATFEFPFENNSLDLPLIEFGIINNSTEKLIYYYGDADIGVIIRIHAIGSASNITIYNTGTHESMIIDTNKLEVLTGFGVIQGDDIIISTVKGSKSIFLLRDGIYTNILNCLDKESDWLQLTRGDNVFAYTAESGSTNLNFIVEHQTIYEGV